MNEVKGRVQKIYGENALMIDKKLYSQYGGLDPKPSIGDEVSFKFTTKDKDGKTYNNVVPGSLEITARAPKDVSSSYPGLGVAEKASSGIDKDTLIVRQSCLKAAVEFGASDIEILLKNAKEFERWVFRQDGS